jgi:putative heme-binding domain-containing protein
MKQLVLVFSVVCSIGVTALASGRFPPLSGAAPANGNMRPPAKTADTQKDDASPWGIASGAEWSGDYPNFNPMLKKAGVRWLRLFPEWQTIQPKKDQWNWKTSDALVADARTNNIHLLGIWCYLAPWTSADGGTRKFPIKDIQYWREYVGRTAARYKDDIQYWEVWNEFNGSFGDSKNKVKDYAELAVTAYDAAKKVNLDAKVGLSVANFDVGFLDAVIKAGAADHFDFICVHPYENLGAVADGGEVGFLSLAGNLRKMLAANNQRKDIPLWITEIGFQAPIKAEAKGDAEQADLLAKAYLLSIVQGFERIFWFEARGPAYGKGTDHGIILSDWTPRPAYDTLKTMTTLLGQEPRYLGWLDLGKGGYGFLFKADKENVLAAWSPAGKQHKAKFDAAAALTDLAGKQSKLTAGQELVLTQAPVFVSELPSDLVKQAQANVGKPYPWGGDYANAKVVTCRLAATNTEDGLKQVNPKTTVIVNDLVESYRRPDFANPALKNEGRYAYFRVDPQFVPFGTKDLEITIVAKRLAPDKEAGMNLTYESAKGYRGAGTWWTIPKDDKWHENTWKVGDANFVGQWGWNFRFDANGSRNEFLMKEVRVRKLERREDKLAPAKMDSGALRQAAMNNTGKPERGRTIFASATAQCAACHKVNGQGGEIGPGLSQIGGKYDRPHLIGSILDPSSEIVQGYQSSIIETKAGRIITGIVKSESKTTISLLDAERKLITLAVEDIESRAVTKVSLMPAGLADGMTSADFTDLIAYLETLRTRPAPTPGESISGPLTLPKGFKAEVVATKLTGATAMDITADGRIFICEQTGALRVFKDGKLVAEPFVKLPVDTTWERGLIGATVAPDFPKTPHVFVCYVAAKPYPHHVVSRFTAAGDVAEPNSEKILLEGDDQTKLGGTVPAGHQGGAIHFGKDGKLYIAIGDQTAGKPAQELNSILGRLLRINADGTIPANNPFAAKATGKYRATWALGMRNPFTFAVQPETGRLFINDVGGKSEEINEGFAGANYGWPIVDHGPTTNPDFRGPIHHYPEACIAGGAFAPIDLNWPREYRGMYFFGDFKHGWVKTIDPAKPALAHSFAFGLRRPVDLRFAADGSLYVLLRDAWVIDNLFKGETGALLRIRHTGN